MTLNYIIIILLVFIFVYIKLSSSNKKIESFSNNNQLSSSEKNTNNLKDSTSIDNGDKDILKLIDDNVKKFKISDKQYQQIISDIKYFFKYQKSKFVKKKIEGKNFMISFSSNKIISLPYYKKIELYIFIYLYLNQDLISKKQLYEDYKQQFGPFLYFIKLDEYINKNNNIYQRVPYNYSKILDIQDIIYLYESLRINGVISFLSLVTLKKHYNQYIKKKKVFVKQRVPITIQNSNDPNYHFYSQNLKEINKFSKELGYEGINSYNDYIDISYKEKHDNIQEFKSDPNYSQDSILPLEYRLKKSRKKKVNNNKDLNMLNDKFINPIRDPQIIRYSKNNHFMLKPLKWKCQRQWEETEGPNFIDKDYIYPGAINCN